MLRTKQEKNEKMAPIIGTLTGLIAGAIYFSIGESGIPKDSNASYLNPISTDIGAWTFGSFVIYKGFKYKDGSLSFIGAAIVSIHISQFAAHKILKHRKLNQKS